MQTLKEVNLDSIPLEESINEYFEFLAKVNKFARNFIENNEPLKKSLCPSKISKRKTLILPFEKETGTLKLSLVFDPDSFSQKDDEFIFLQIKMRKVGFPEETVNVKKLTIGWKDVFENQDEIKEKELRPALDFPRKFWSANMGEIIRNLSQK